jgi:hypothetical protein
MDGSGRGRAVLIGGRRCDGTVAMVGSGCSITVLNGGCGRAEPPAIGVVIDRYGSISRKCVGGRGLPSLRVPIHSRRSGGLRDGLPRLRFDIRLSAALRLGRGLPLGIVLWLSSVLWLRSVLPHGCATLWRGFALRGRTLSGSAPLGGRGMDWCAMNRGGRDWSRSSGGRRRGSRPGSLRFGRSQRQQRNKTRGKRQPQMLLQGFTHRYNHPQPADFDHLQMQLLWLAGIIDAAGGLIALLRAPLQRMRRRPDSSNDQ